MSAVQVDWTIIAFQLVLESKDSIKVMLKP